MFVQLGQKQLLSSIRLNFFFRAVVLICTTDHMGLHNFLFCSKVVRNSFELLKYFEHFIKIKLGDCMFYNVKQHTQKMN